MRTLDAVLVILVVACGVLALKLDGKGDEDMRALNERMDGVDRSLSEMTERLNALIGEQKQSVLTAPKPRAPDASALEMRVARIEKHLGTISSTIERIATRGEQAPPTTAAAPTPAGKQPPADAEVQPWIEKLESGDEEDVFKSTLELAKLGSPLAIPGLIKVLRTHRDFYARLGAATALGELRAADAVPHLIDGLNDKDDLVRTASSEALHRITKMDFRFVSGLAADARHRIQQKYRAWWQDNETAVRERIARDK